MNSVNVVGRLVTDVDLHHNGQGRPTAIFNIAIDDRRNGNDGPVLVTVVSHDTRAATVAKYLRRDRLVSLEGRLQQVSGANQHRQWTRLQIAASWIGFLDERPVPSMCATTDASAGGDSACSSRPVGPLGDPAARVSVLETPPNVAR